MMMVIINPSSNYIIIKMSYLGYKVAHFYNNWTIKPCFLYHHVTLLHSLLKNSTVNLNKTYSYIKFV